MKVYNDNKLKLAKKIEPFLLIIKILRLPLYLLVILIRFFRKNRPDFFVADGFLIGDCVLARPLIKAVLRKDPKSYYMAGRHAKFIFFDSKINLIENQWPWANYDYSLRNWLKQLLVWFKILWLQPKTIIELRGDLRSLFFLYLTCPKSLIGFSFTGGKMFLTKEPNLPKKVMHLEAHNYALAKLLNLDYQLKKDLKIENRLKKEQRIIGLSFAGSLPLKTLPIKMAKIILDTFKNDAAVKLVYLKSPHDYFLDNHEAVIQEYKIEIWEGAFSNYFDFMQTLSGYIGMDSAGGHIAALFQIPSLIFFGTQESSFSKPINEQMIILEMSKSLFCRPCASKICVNSVPQACLTGIDKQKIGSALTWLKTRTKI
ncbi:MAG: hypothetical protein WC860_08680 [Candidatus Margulisiibacteriota bacterium]|jgi:ADP-heptose:LPS heptosyltransferase